MRRRYGWCALLVTLLVAFGGADMANAEIQPRGTVPQPSLDRSIEPAFAEVAEPFEYSRKGPDLPGLHGAPPLLLNFRALDFDGNSPLNGGFVYIPPDPIGAAGERHLVNVGNVYIEWYDKGTGTLQNQQGLGTFFASLNPPPISLFDPKVRYDQYAGRFVVVVLEQQDTFFGGPANTSRILVAVSKTNDPNAGWWFQAINSMMTINGVPSWADYPGLGLDDKAVYITNNMFGFAGFGGGYQGSRLWIVHKDWYNGPDNSGTVTVHHPQGVLGTFDTTTQAAHMYGTPPGNTGTFLVAYSGISDGVSEFAQVMRVDNPLGAVGFDLQFVNFGDIEGPAFPSLPDAPQMGGPALIEVNDRRALDAVWRSSRLVMTTTIYPNTGPDMNQTTAHFFEIDTSNLPALAASQQASIGAEDLGLQTYTYFPSVTVDHCNNIAIGFCASNEQIFAGAYYTGQDKAVDAPGTVQPTGTLKLGEDYYLRTFGAPRNRWGDYTGISLCPVDQITFWTYNQYAWLRGTPIGGEDGRWGTWWGEWKFSSCIPVAVAITNFDATVTGHGVELRSEFASTFDVLNINIYRGNGEGEPELFKSVAPEGRGFNYVDSEVEPGKSYSYRLGVVDRDGEYFSQMVDVRVPDQAVSLGQNKPNPFNPTTSIAFTLPVAQHVQVDIYDAAGRFVTQLFNGNGRSGENNLQWDGTNADGARVGSGVYYYKLTAGTVQETRKMVLLK